MKEKIKFQIVVEKFDTDIIEIKVKETSVNYKNETLFFELNDMLNFLEGKIK